ncbi:unnamed protein product [Pedinophyceae sp. YPF-701]|nr:unnamed protein product [Pedinophyceae sp. YPF-701]
MAVMEAESIYALIPRPQEKVVRPPRHKSKFPGNPRQGANGTLHMGTEPKAGATFGPPPEAVRPNPKQFLKSHTGEPVLPEPTAPSKTKSRNKPPVPSRKDKPIMSLVSQKNYVTANAVEVILAQPKKHGTGDLNWTTKPDFGKVPSYLTKNKAKLETEKRAAEEYKKLQEAQQLADAGVVQELEPDERGKLLRHLKIKWAQVNTAYQKMTFTLDTPAKRRRKEQYEKELSEIERDIRMLEKGETVLVVEG